MLFIGSGARTEGEAGESSRKPSESDTNVSRGEQAHLFYQLQGRYAAGNQVRRKSSANQQVFQRGKWCDA